MDNADFASIPASDLSAQADESPPSLTERQELFLDIVSSTGLRDTEAYQMVGITRWTLWRWKQDPDFLTRYEEARKVSVKHLIKEAERRAMNGSDRMLIFLLTNYDPEHFSDRSRIDHTTDNDLAERLARGRDRFKKSTEPDAPVDPYDVIG